MKRSGYYENHKKRDWEMLVDDMVVKNGKALFRTKDVMEKARRSGIKNP